MELHKLLCLHIQYKTQLSPRTIDKYKEVIRIFTQDTGIIDTSITYEEFINWRNNLYERVSPSTCNIYHRHMKALFNTAVKFGHLEENIFTKLPLLQIKNVKPKIIPNEDIIKLKTYIQNDQYYSINSWFYLALIDTLLFTGIRRRQLIGIKLKHIDFNNKVLHLSAVYSKNGNENTIPLNDILVEHFLNLKKNMGLAVNDQIFNVTKIGKSYKDNITNERHITDLFSKWSKNTNISLSPHRFRHTFATKIARNGGNMKSLQKMMGHSKIDTTLAYYDLDIDDLRTIQDLL
jgi:integrase